MIYKGGCHCGKVAIEVEGELREAITCNCSICTRKASILWAVPRDKLRLLTSEDAMGAYTFNKHKIKHRFCLTCGIHPYAEADGEPWAMVNVRCLDDVDVGSLSVHEFDGRSM